MNISTVYTSVGFIVQLYILKLILEKGVKDWDLLVCNEFPHLCLC
jgi:hypothetical protein